jgi:hypothetical protein
VDLASVQQRTVFANAWLEGWNMPLELVSSVTVGTQQNAPMTRAPRGRDLRKMPLDVLEEAAERMNARGVRSEVLERIIRSKKANV